MEGNRQVNTPKFKQGQRVRCVDAKQSFGLKANEVYTCKEDSCFSSYGDEVVQLVECERGNQYLAVRFELDTSLNT
jgi:hypothetical protein